MLCLLSLQSELAAVKMNNMLSNSAAISSSDQSIFGCGLAYLRTKIQEHYNDEPKRFNKLSIRIIGQQAIALARNSFQLVGCLKTADETEGEKLKRLALCKIVEYLRNASGLFNKIHIVSLGEIDQLEEFCQLYFNLLVLFFPESVMSLSGLLHMPYHFMQESCMKNMVLVLAYYPCKQKSPNMLA